VEGFWRLVANTVSTPIGLVLELTIPLGSGGVRGLGAAVQVIQTADVRATGFGGGSLSDAPDHDDFLFPFRLFDKVSDLLWVQVKHRVLLL
jgi:hypothetical protein